MNIISATNIFKFRIILIPRSPYRHSTYIPALLYYSFCRISQTNHPNFYYRIFIYSNFCTTNSICPFKINNFTIILQIIKFSKPIRADREDIYIIFFNICNLLPFIFFNNNFICQSRTSNSFNAFKNRLLNI